MLKAASHTEELCAELQKALTDSVVMHDEPLAKRTTLRVGGNADLYIEPASERDLAETLEFCGRHHLPLFMLGRGSNLLIRDEGIRGLVACLGNSFFSKIQVEGNELHCGAGAKLKAVAAAAREAGLSGMEFMEGIPGSVGGALRMNAGAMGCATFNVVKDVRVMDPYGHVHDRVVAQVPSDYRCCPLFKSHLALAATFRGQPASKEEIIDRTRAFNEKRWQSQPKESSAGCIFKNPSKTVCAGKLIDELGLKGTRVGAASVSQVHANFIVNEGGASAREVLELIQLIQTRVKEERGIDLQTEVEIVGDDS
jgi:UDP-N-acetylenolpyruvoylglucosamine reductase